MLKNYSILKKNISLFLITFLLALNVNGQGNALEFDGANDYVELGAYSFYSGSFTIEAWVKPVNSNDGTILSVRDGNNSAITIQILTDGTVQFLIRNPASNTGGVLVTSTSAIDDNTWHHVAATKEDDDKLRIYIDGVLEATSPGTIADFGATTHTVDVGRLVPTVTRYYEGQMDELRLWDKGLTDAEITVQYNKTYSNPTSLSACLEAYYKMNESTGTSLPNQVSASHTGTLINMDNTDWVASTVTVTTTAPTCNTLTEVYADQGNALELDGVNDYVELGAYSFYSGSFTMEAWVKPVNSNDGTILSVRDGNNSAITVQIFTNGTVEFLIRNPASNVGGVFVTSTSAIDDNTWHHVAATKEDDDKLRIYIDGVLEATSATSIADFGATTHTVDVGRLAPSVTRYYEGQMDELRLWDKGLTAAEITDQYNKTYSNPTTLSACLEAYYKMNESTGTSLPNQVSASHTGTLINMDDTDWVTSTVTVTTTAPTCNSLALPVELSFFKYQVMQEAIQLKWQTLSETNNEGFDIEKSTNGIEWENIHYVTGIGNTLATQDYQFVDNRPFVGLNYYRLKQIDFDGKYEYSPVVTATFQKKNDQHLGMFYPNPSKAGIVNLEYHADHNDKMEVIVYDITGGLILSRVQPISKGNNQLNFDFSNLKKGIYVVMLEDKINTFYRKLVIE